MLEKEVVSIKLGKFQIEFDSVGKRKLSLEAVPGVVADAEFNERSGEFGGALTLKGKDLATALRKRAGSFPAKSPQAEQLQRYASWLDAFELQLMAGFVGTREETILSILARSPGFFERRSTQELFRPESQWNQLMLAEQANLVTLGWAQDTWDRKYLEGARLPASVAKARTALSEAEKIAIVRLGFHAYEEYGVKFREKRSEFSDYTF